MNNPVVLALLANNHITTGANIAPKKPKLSTISIEEANECTDNYSKKLCTNENPYYYIESDDVDAENRYSVPTLDKYDRKTGKPIISRLEQLEYEWAMNRCCR